MHCVHCTLYAVHLVFSNMLRDLPLGLPQRLFIADSRQPTANSINENQANTIAAIAVYEYRSENFITNFSFALLPSLRPFSSIRLFCLQQLVAIIFASLYVIQLSYFALNVNGDRRQISSVHCAHCSHVTMFTHSSHCTHIRISHQCIIGFLVCFSQLVIVCNQFFVSLIRFLRLTPDLQIERIRINLDVENSIYLTISHICHIQSKTYYINSHYEKLLLACKWQRLEIVESATLHIIRVFGLLGVCFEFILTQ